MQIRDRSLSIGNLLADLLVAVALAVSLTIAADPAPFGELAAQPESSTSEARIAVRALEDGRVEVALE